ncbi:LmeA family phospholipid-binding protein [Leptolyngbya ohadii]|uniref:LmeA family phospholipid-binding protein n=1 Tax=Leptolyngbya ohadii TaxID=1962290 RepID=UPI000B59FB3C|nr:DUF2993 domain-containing protein [Leptolyngbya ohadii]
MPIDHPSETDHPSRRSRLISSVLSPAVRLWLRSQVESVADLQFQLEGGDRQILSGYVPKVSIAARQAVYQGLHLSQVDLTGENIRINLGQVLRGKSLQLLEVVPVFGNLILHQRDLTASLQAPLLATALSDLLTILFQPETRHLLPPELASALGTDTVHLTQPQIELGHQQLTLGGILTNTNNGTNRLPLLLRTGISLSNRSKLCLQHPELLPTPTATESTPLPHLHEFAIDLGQEVELQELLLEPERLVCRGRISVVP